MLRAVTAWVRRGSSRDITVLYYLRDRLIAADCVNRPRDFLAVKRALGEGRTIPAGPAADASTALKELITAP